MKALVVPGLALYCISSSLGLFLGPDPFGVTMIVWLAGLVVLASALLYDILVSPPPVPAFPLIALGILVLNFVIQITGGIHSSLWPSYFLFAVLIAGLSSRPVGRTSAVVGLIIAIEIGNLAAPREVREFRWETVLGYMISLAAVSLITSFVMRRVRVKEEQVRHAHEQLLAHAEAVDPLSDETKLPALTHSGRQAANVEAAIKRESTFNGLLDFIYELVPAHTYALFLKERKTGKDVLVLRAIRSESTAIVRTGSITAIGPDRDQWVIAACADTGQTKHLESMTVPSSALGYYLTDVPVRSFIAFPVVDGFGSVLGVLAADSLEEGAFGPETRQVLDRFTPFFIQVIERIRIAQELNVRASHFEALHEMSSVLSGSLELDAILNRLAEQLNLMVPHDFCVFLRYDEQTREAALLHGSGSLFSRDDSSLAHRIAGSVRSLLGMAGDESARTFPVSQSGIVTQMLKQWETGRNMPYHFPDLGDRSEEMALLGADLPVRGLRSLSCWPLVAGKKFIGAFFLGAAAPAAFSELQFNFLDTLMNQAAVVMDNVILHQRIKNMAHTDGLTGLLNHRTFMEKMTDEFKRLDRNESPHFSLLLFDIDFFKKVNDEHGHPVGDVALRTIADVVRNMARGIDFVARYGGEEFAVGMVGADLQGAKVMAERIRKAVESTVIVAGDVTLRKTVSIGVGSYYPGCAKKEVLISEADQALYHAKHSGRNRVCLYEDIRESVKSAGSAPH